MSFPLLMAASGSSTPPDPPAHLSVFGTSPPPGTYSVFTDNPFITVAGKFYRYGGILTGTPTIIGARVWLPDAAPGSTFIRVMLWTTGNISADPDREIGVPIVGTGWHEGVFASPAALPADGVEFRVGYQFIGNDATYVFTSSFRSGGVPVRPQNNGLSYSESSSVFRDGGGPELTASNPNVYYGVDVLVSP